MRMDNVDTGQNLPQLTTGGGLHARNLTLVGGYIFLKLRKIECFAGNGHQFAIYLRITRSKQDRFMTCSHKAADKIVYYQLRTAIPHRRYRDSRRRYERNTHIRLRPIRFLGLVYPAGFVPGAELPALA